MPSPVSEECIARTLRALKANGFLAYYFPEAQEACAFVMDSVDLALPVGFASSALPGGAGLMDRLKGKGAQVLDHRAPDLTAEAALAVRRAQLHCGLFLGTADAVTEQGEVVAGDDVGSALCSMTFGPRKVILLVGVQNVVPDRDAAFRKVAASADARGSGEGGSSPERTYSATLVLHERPRLTDVTVVLVGG